MKKGIRLLILICIVFLSACQLLAVNSLTSTPSEEGNTSSGTLTEISTAQVPSVQCPKEDPKLAFGVEQAWQSTAPGEQNQHFTNYVLDFLNSGGTPQS